MSTTSIRGLGGHDHFRLNKSPGDEELFIYIGNYMYLTFIVRIFGIVLYLIIIYS